MAKKNIQALVAQVAAHDDFGNFRYIVIDDEIWFVAVDICKILGYKNSRDALSKHVEAEDKKSVDLNSVANRDGIRDAVFDGWIKNEVTIINESGLYSLIFGSQLPTAKKFTRWVTSEVLPSIRKTGSYSLPKKRIFKTNQDIDLYEEFDNGEYEITSINNATIEYDENGKIIAIYDENSKAVVIYA